MTASSPGVESGAAAASSVAATSGVSVTANTAASAATAASSACAAKATLLLTTIATAGLHKLGVAAGIQQGVQERGRCKKSGISKPV